MDICSEIKNILNELDSVLPYQDITEAKEYIFHNEFGIAFEFICTQIIEHELKISRRLFNKIQLIADHMFMGNDCWKEIKVDENLT